MEKKKARKNLLPPDTPDMLTEITLAYMKAYMKDCPREEQIWYASLVANNQKYMPNHLKGAKGHDNDSDTVLRIDIKPVRAEFAKKYFPSLYEKARVRDSKKSYLENLLADFDIDSSELDIKPTKAK